MLVIETLASSREGLTLTQLCACTSLPKTSLFSLLNSLSDGGFIIPEGKNYRLGPETYRIAAIIHRADRFPGNVHTLLQALQKDCGETVLIGVPTDDWSSMVYVDVVESSSWLRYYANVGAHRPMHSTAAGKILLAFANDDQRSAYLKATALTRHNPQTIAARKEFLRELSSIRQQGIVISQASIEGATGIAAPIFDNLRQLIAAVGAVGPSGRLLARQRDVIKTLLLQHGEAMSRKLGYEGAYPRI